MNLTPEQQSILQSNGNIKINAVAGSGKTTTVIEYARIRPANSKILYLAFNRSVKLEAQKKFADKGLANVRVETAHSLAYRHIVFKHGYTVRNDKYKTYELAEMLGITGSGEKHYEHILANHVNKFFAYFCNSDKCKLNELNYIDTVTDGKARGFVTACYGYIEEYTQKLWDKMDSGKVDITHDFYLKKFQLSNPNLGFDYILFDEGQDASSAMLDIFLKQNAVRVIVGDAHQQIYGWRYAVNSLEKVDYVDHYLSTSFRFHSDIATLATEILERKTKLREHTRVTINGAGQSADTRSKAVLGRTNLGLLVKAIEYITEKKNLKGLYFEGNINSYTYAEEGASLYDVLNLYNGNHGLIKDKLIKSMKDLAELEDYIEKTEEVQLGMMVELVLEYGNKIPGLIKKLKEKHVGNEEREKAEVIFSTVHRCKGMEYDTVYLANDFMTDERMEKVKAEIGDNEIARNKLIEEINLLYVAVTRTRNTLHIPEELLPENFTPSPRIIVLKKEPDQPTTEVTYTNKNIPERDPRREKAYSVAKIREKLPQAYASWTDEDDDELTEMFMQEISVKDMALHFGRTRGAIRSRIKKLELEAKYM